MGPRISFSFPNMVIPRREQASCGTSRHESNYGCDRQQGARTSKRPALRRWLPFNSNLLRFEIGEIEFTLPSVYQHLHWSRSTNASPLHRSSLHSKKRLRARKNILETRAAQASRVRPASSKTDKVVGHGLRSPRPIAVLLETRALRKKGTSAPKATLECSM